ncbi:MAG: beta-propeller fold lactonase family protein, partial [Chthoniobacteraceae bacterium]
MDKFLWSFCGLVAPATLLAQGALEAPSIPSAPNTEVLKEVQIISPDDLRSVTGIDISADGKFVYTAAFNSSNVRTFSRDSATGALTAVDA